MICENGVFACSSILSPSEQRLDLVVSAQKRHEEVGRPILKDKTQVAIAATFKELIAQFTNSKAGVRMRLPERIRQFAQSQ